MPKIIAISGEIGWDVWPDRIREQIEAAEGEDIEFQISSPGGYIYDGLEIFNLIRGYEGKTTTVAVGMAASMASYLLMAGDEKKAYSNAIFMIHNARAFTGGDQIEHRKLANILEGMSNLLGQEYVKKTGKEKSEISEMMNAETYLFGNEILDNGFVDEIIDIEDETARDELITDAMAKVESCIQKVKSKPEKIEKIAAVLKIEEPKKTQTPAQPDTSAKAQNQKPKNEVNMTLDEFLAQNPEAKVLYDERLKVAKETARAEGVQSVRADVAKLAPYMQSDEYDAAIKETAIDALNGEIEISAFLTTVKIEDRRKEKAKADATKSEKVPDTPTGELPTSNPEKPKNADDMKEMVAAMKNKKSKGE